MSFLEFDSFVTHLPPESAYKTWVRDQLSDEEIAAIEPTSHGQWSRELTMLAAIYDGIQQLTWVQIVRAGVKQDPPKPLRRPGIADSAVPSQTAAYRQRMADYMAAVRLRNAHTET